ncbi:MAG: hypothetical protein U9P11_03870, partial [Pseudomonadota bacterium]|nr:hypothetical protein [Pseudomonadota bacterium]
LSKTPQSVYISSSSVSIFTTSTVLPKETLVCECSEGLMILENKKPGVLADMYVSKEHKQGNNVLLQ